MSESRLREGAKALEKALNFNATIKSELVRHESAGKRL
jgi:hypothetical protein